MSRGPGKGKKTENETDLMEGLKRPGRRLAMTVPSKPGFGPVLTRSRKQKMHIMVDLARQEGA